MTGLHLTAELLGGYLDTTIYSITGVVGYAFGSYVISFVSAAFCEPHR
jgi:hypothetical protein